VKIRKGFKNIKGVSLAEVLVSLAIIMTIASIYTSLYFSGTTANIKSKERLDAIIQAQNIIEELKVTDEIQEGIYEITKGKYSITQIISIDKSENNCTLYNVIIKVTTPNTSDVTISTKLFRGIVENETNKIDDTIEKE